VIRRTITLTLLLLILAPAAASADKAKARALFDRATKQYNLGEYATAAEAFKAAYDEYPDPTLLYNLAQCERQLAHKSRAITLYRSYLRELPDAPNAAEARRLVASLEQDVAREEKQRKAAEARAHALEQQRQEQHLQDQRAASVVSPTVEPPTSRARAWWKNPAGWALIGVGVAAGAAGTGLLVAANNDQNSAPKAATLADAHSLVNEASTFRAAGYAMVGIAGAAAVAGVLVLALMPSRWKTHAAIAPQPGGAMVAVGGWR
jgi:tetratricopeptide (TPR) repeat protein